MTSFGKKIAHMRNKRLDEGTLRNALLEIKEVAKPWGAVVKQQSTAVKEMLKWAHSQTLPVINEAMSQMVQLEVEFNDAITQYTDDYNDYHQRWTDILDERKELKLLMDEHKKAETAVEAAMSKMAAADKAEHKLRAKGSRESMSPIKEGTASSPGGSQASGLNVPQESPEKRRLSFGKKPITVETARELVLKAQAEERAQAEKVQQKTLEVQKEVHILLRAAFYNLSSARMRLCKRAADIAEKEIGIASGIPEVVGFDDEGSFQTQAVTEKLGPLVGTQWHHGDVLEHSLEIEREASRHAVEAEAQRRREEVAKVTAHAEEVEQKLRASFMDLERQHNELIDSLKRAADQKEGTLHDQVNRLMMENHQLNENMRAMQENILKMVLGSASAGIDDAVHGVDEDIVFFYCARVDAAVVECHHLLAQHELDKVQAALRVTTLDRAVTATVLSAVSVGYSLPAEQSAVLFPLAKEAAMAAKMVSDAFVAALDPATAKEATVQLSPLHPLCTGLNESLQKLRRFGEELLSDKELPEQISKTVHAAKQAITDAKSYLERLQTESKAGDKDRLLEVNQGMLNTSVQLIAHADKVIDSALQMKKDMENSSTDAGAHSLRTFATFWRDGLQTAVTNVVDNLPVWLECARATAKDRAKFEEFQVSTKNMAACSAQLVALARSSKKGIKLDIEKATDSLISTSHTLAVTIREAQNLQLASIMLEDFSTLTEMQANRMIMNCQVESLRLEAALDREREKLGRLRRLNYADMKSSHSKAAAAAAVMPEQVVAEAAAIEPPSSEAAVVKHAPKPTTNSPIQSNNV